MDYLEQLTDDLCIHGYHIVDNFLEPKHYLDLKGLGEQWVSNGSFQKAKIGTSSHIQMNSSVRSDHILWLDELNSEASVQLYLQKMHLISQHLNRALFLGLHELEAHFASYPSGSFYKKHVDQFISKKTRKISCVYYLNETWQFDFGGILKLYNLNDIPLKEVSPLGNRFICFNSELPHEVTETRHPRLSIAAWMKSQA